jgi:hypothetical protein
MTAIAACRTCGTEPLENARFYHGCGSPVKEAHTRAEYKQVTVLFADEHNHRHSALRYRTPAEYAAQCSHTHHPVACDIN